MKKVAIAFLLCFAVFHPLSAQSQGPARFSKAVFVEAFGLGIQASLNYDMRIIKGRQDGLGFRLGLGGTFTGSSDADAGPVASGIVHFPLGINYLVGKKQHAFEGGLGINPHYAKTDLYSPTKPRLINENGWGNYGFVNLGYRFQPLNNGFVFRFNWTPLISGQAVVPAIFGISAGYGFK